MSVGIMLRVETRIGVCSVAALANGTTIGRALRLASIRPWSQPEGPAGVGRAAMLSGVCMDVPCRTPSTSHRIPTPAGAGYDSY